LLKEDENSQAAVCSKQSVYSRDLMSYRFELGDLYRQPQFGRRSRPRLWKPAQVDGSGGGDYPAVANHTEPPGRSWAEHHRAVIINGILWVLATRGRIVA